MQWIAKENNPPIYIWPDDTWYNETDKTVYVHVFSHRHWNGKKLIPFPKKARIMQGEYAT